MLVSTQAHCLKKFSFSPSVKCTESLFNVSRKFTVFYEGWGKILYEYDYSYIPCYLCQSSQCHKEVLRMRYTQSARSCTYILTSSIVFWKQIKTTSLQVLHSSGDSEVDNRSCTGNRLFKLSINGNCKQYLLTVNMLHAIFKRLGIRKTRMWKMVIYTVMNKLIKHRVVYPVLLKLK